MTSPLIERLATEFGYPTLDRETVTAFLSGPGARILFLTGDPAKLSHTNDVAVVLPEIVAAFGGGFEAAVLGRDLERDVMPALGILVLPALAFLRDGRMLGVLSRMQDWDIYLAKAAEFLNGEGKALPPVDLGSGGAERTAGAP
jgi:hydrogenase-1 operon protein HyaE